MGGKRAEEHVQNHLEWCTSSKEKKGLKSGTKGFIQRLLLASLCMYQERGIEYGVNGIFQTELTFCKRRKFFKERVIWKATVANKGDIIAVYSVKNVWIDLKEIYKIYCYKQSLMSQ
jgi:hypothetical protein